MYTGFPYMIPNIGMQTVAPAASGLANAANLGNAATASSASSLLSRINWSSILSNAQKTLNVVNQAIPLYYQVKPVFKNLRTLGKIGKEFTKIGNTQNSVNQNTNENVNLDNNTSPDVVENNEITQSIPTPKFFL